MNKTTIPTYGRVALLMAALYTPALWAASAARVEFAFGNAVLIGSDGKERPAVKGDSLSPGERIQTRAGRVQVAFSDGAFVSLQPNTDFGIDQYAFSGKADGTEKGVFSVLKGALRTVTGIIGRGRKDAYRIETPTSTIGIRGTGGLIEVTDAGTRIIGTSGTWTLTNRAGTVDIPAGTTGFAGRDRSAPPQTGGTPPLVPPPQAQQPAAEFVSGNQIAPSGTPAPVATPATGAMAAGSNYAVAFTWSGGGGSLVQPATTTFNAGTTLASFANGADTLVQGDPAKIFDSGNDGIVGWGRWTGPVSISGSNYVYGPNEGMHYVVGVPTAVLPGGSATYSLAHATQPTHTGGTYVPGTLTVANMGVNFGTSQVTSLTLSADLNSKTYTVNNVGPMTISAGAFSGSLSGNSSSGCSWTNCTGTVYGAFFGTNAERAGISYSISGFDPGPYVPVSLTGAAVLKSP